MNAMPAAAHAAAKLGILREEAVAGMDRVRARLARRVQDGAARQVAVSRAAEDRSGTARSASSTCWARASASE